MSMPLYTSHKSNTMIQQFISSLWTSMTSQIVGRMSAPSWHFFWRWRKDNWYVASYSPVLKFCDMIQHGSKFAGCLMSLDFYMRTDTFCFASKKSVSRQRSRKTQLRGRQMTFVAPPSQFWHCGQWRGEIIVWLFCLCMWHLLACSFKLIVSLPTISSVVFLIPLYLVAMK